MGFCTQGGAASAISAAAPFGSSPTSSSAFARAASTLKRHLSLKSSSQIAFISGVPYLKSIG